MVIQCKLTSAEFEHVSMTEMGLIWGEFKPANWNSTASWHTENDSPYQTQLRALCQPLETQFKLVINIATVNACVQKPGEMFADYFSGKLQVFNMNDQTIPLTTRCGRAIFVGHFVAWQSARLCNIKNYYTHAETVVQDERNLQEIQSNS